MDPKPTLSVIMPFYNVNEEHFEICLDSILTQDYKDFEVIVIDDGSPNSPNEVIESFNDSRIKLKKVENGGQSRARNIAMRMAQGKYIFFVDSDDWIFHNTFEKVMPKMIENDLDILFYGAYEYNDKNGKISLWMNNSELFPLEYTCFKEKDEKIMKDIFSLNNTCWGKVFRKDFLLDNNLFFYEGLIFEDTEFFFRYMLKAQRVGFIRDNLYFYRTNVRSSTISRNNEKHFDLLKIFGLIEETLIENKLFDEFKIKFYSYKINLIGYRYNMLQVDLKPKFKMAIKESLLKIQLTSQEYSKLETKSKNFINYFLAEEINNQRSDRRI